MAFNVKVLKVMKLWLEDDENDKNKWKNIKTYYLSIVLFPSWGPLLLECCFSIFSPSADIVFKIQELLGTVCIIGAMYMGICFVQNRKDIKNLLESIDNFALYTDMNSKQVDQKASFYSKLVIAYGLLGTLIYTTSPLLSRSSCAVKRTQYEIDHGKPCGIIVALRLPFRYDITPTFQLMILHEMLTAGMTALLVVSITMLICGILEHAISQLKEVRKCILNLGQASDEEIVQSVGFAVRYHCAVIEFIERVNECFGSQLVLHFTLTSIVISLLGFEMLMVNDVKESVMYALHLIGWLIILYNICHYGQRLIDQSIGVAEDAYFSPWYKFSVGMQKDIKLIIIRAQKPLTLNAVNLGILSDPTFLGVISSAYSYFTLLLKIKNP
uniref:Odorant receptor n=1 Tax=Holotrichia parallela TaxID=93412 RepID=A0A2P0ZPK9_HOLPA|nr:odorant receptor 27 [Holotrichia parallela]